MSTTLEGIDARGYLQNWLKGLVHMYSADVKAVPDDKWSASMGGCTRTAAELTADAVSLLFWTAEALKGNVIKGGEGDHMAKIKDACSTKDGAIATLNQAAEAFESALAGASEEDLNKSVMAPWGMETPLYMLAQIAVSHVWYHDGQLNYVHCLLGDDKIYWMGG